MNNIAKGVIGENMACKFLKKKGYKILERNCKRAGAELDIVALCPIRAQKKSLIYEYKHSEVKPQYDLKKMIKSLTTDIIVFVEVKYSSTRENGEPHDRVNYFKQNQILKAGQSYITSEQIKLPSRYDVISIVGNEIEHIEDAF